MSANTHAFNGELSNIEDSKKYYTRWGMRTATDAAEECMERATYGMIFLQENFENMDRGDDVTFSGIAIKGLSYIISDITHNVTEAQSFYLGDEDQPAKEREGTP